MNSTELEFEPCRKKDMMLTDLGEHLYEWTVEEMGQSLMCIKNPKKVDIIGMPSIHNPTERDHTWIEIVIMKCNEKLYYPRECAYGDEMTGWLQDVKLMIFNLEETTVYESYIEKPVT